MSQTMSYIMSYIMSHIISQIMSYNIENVYYIRRKDVLFSISSFFSTIIIRYYLFIIYLL